VPDRGRMAGPAAAGVAPRGVALERTRPLAAAQAPGRAPVAIERRGPAADHGRVSPAGQERDVTRVAPHTSSEEGWRSRVAPRATDSRETVPRERAMASERPSSSPSAAARAEAWRSRSDVPPAQRVIEGAVAGHRVPEARSETFRARELPPVSPQRIEGSPSAAPPRMRSTLPATPPRFERPPSYAPPAAVERAPAPRAEIHHEAPPRQAPPQAPRQAPAPRAERERPH
jgi:hypothetical protein